MIAVAVAALWCAPVAVAGTTIGFGSSVGATNITSYGGLVDESFMFQLGTFEGGFIPTAQNTDLWLQSWREASDVEGQPLQGNTAPYRTDELGGVFPPGMRVNSFTSSVTLDHNTPPFDLGGQLYIWGYNRRALPGSAEWILISDPSWIWPDGSSNLPAASYSVSRATIAVLGEIQGDGFEMMTAAVTVPGSSAEFYEGWLHANFSAGVLGDPGLELEVWGDHADPDEDGLSNLMEYFIAGDPQAAEPVEPLAMLEVNGDEISVEFRQSLSAVGVVGQVEWSDDLSTWSRVGIEQVPLGEDSTHATVRASRVIGNAPRAYFRLTVQRAP
ncbi:MAG: hypothetical protein ACR2RV_18345 [Verrucomicrobiales bacterium]